MSRAPSLLLCVTLSGLVLTVDARDLRVTTGEDSFDGHCDAHCSLRDAVAEANSQADADRILLQAMTYQLSLAPAHGEEGEILDEDANLDGDLDILNPVTILGLGAQQSLIDGAGLDRLLEVMAGSTLEVRNLTLRNGRTSFYGGAIENHGDTRLRGIRLENNRAWGAFEPGSGAGIANYGNLSVHSSVLQNNSAIAGEAYQGRGGGIFNSGTLLVRDSSFSGNHASDDDDTGMGGGLYNQGSADVARSTFSGNSSSGSGAAINNLGQLKLTNSTLSGSSLQSYRNGAAFNNGQDYPPFSGIPQALLINVTIAGNLGYGLSNYGQLLLRNSLIAGNTDEYGETAHNCGNFGSSATYRARGLLLGSGPGNCTADYYVENAETFTHLLYPLSDNNANTQTHALRKGSLAVDAGIGSCTQHDQRGLTRPRDGDGDDIAVCDLGAYERAKP